MKKKLLLILMVISFLIIGCGKTLTSEGKIIEIYKELDASDFKSQEIVDNMEESNKLLTKIYVEPALSEKKESLQIMREENIRNIHYDVIYKNIQVKKLEEDKAILKVESQSTGGKFTLSDPNRNLGSFTLDFKREITLKNIKGNWYISNVNISPDDNPNP